MRKHRLALVLGLSMGLGGQAWAVRDTSNLATDVHSIPGLRWVTELPESARIAHGSEERLYVAGDRQILALDLGLGTIVWQRPAEPGTSMLLVQGDQVLAVAGQALRCWHGPSGRLIWSRDWNSTGHENADVLGIEAMEGGWLVRSLGLRQFTERLSADGLVQWRVGVAQGGTWLHDGLLFGLTGDGVLSAHELEGGTIVWVEQLEAGAYRLEAEGILSEVATGRRWMRIAKGPKLEPAPPVQGAVPQTVRQGAVQCEMTGCRVETHEGWKWFDGYVQLLGDELRVFQGATAPADCIGCLGQPQPRLLRVESWDRQGTQAFRKAFVRRLQVHEDALGFIEVDGTRVVATDWMAP